MSLSTAPVIVPVGPCGCFACEKWADCNYCSFCNPEAETAFGSCGCTTCQKRDDLVLHESMEASARSYDLWRREDEMSYSEWLASR